MDINLTEEELSMLNQAIEEAHEEQEEGKIIIPKNSNTLLVDETSSRFSDAEWFEKIKQQNITLAGVGGIGSWAALILSRTKVGNINIYDPDIVDESNISGQLYGIDDIGSSKAISIAKIMKYYSSYYNVNVYRDMFTYSTPSTKIAIGGFDNMNARKHMFMSWKRNVELEPYPDQCLLIDARLAAEEFQVFCVKGDEDYLIDKYEKEWLFSDEEAEYTICSYKQTSYCANMVASVIVNLLVNFIANQCNPVVQREVPFMTSYNAQLMQFKTSNS